MTPKTATASFSSPDEFASAAYAARDQDAPNVTLAEAVKVARYGWTEQLTEALDVAEHAVELCETEHEVLRSLTRVRCQR